MSSKSELAIVDSREKKYFSYLSIKARPDFLDSLLQGFSHNNAIRRDLSQWTSFFSFQSYEISP